MDTNILKKLYKIQQTLKAPKSNFNGFGKYKYRSCEDILEAIKPLLKDNHCILTISDEVICIGERNYIKAIVKISDVQTGESYITEALARESKDKKGMDDSQLTGSTSSYARKYALSGMFAIDDTKDADTEENKK